VLSGSVRYAAAVGSAVAPERRTVPAVTWLPMRALVVAALLALFLAPAALATGRSPLQPRFPPHEQVTRAQAIANFLAEHKVVEWLDRYPRAHRFTEATYDKDSGNWTVKVWWGEAGEIATGQVDAATGVVTEAWTGPQVAWKMARGYPGAFGGRVINKTWVWLAFCAAFFVGLANLRRPFSIRNLDLLVLLSFSVSLWYFNRGDVFTSMPLAYPPLLYLLARMLWIAARGRNPAPRPVWPVWLLVASAVFLLGFRIGIDIQARKSAASVIDVGYSGVIGADRIAHGQAPYGHMPVEDSLKPCGPADASGEIRERVQTNGRCESANERGDTYGPASYEAYLPGYLAFGWSGKWDRLPAAHATAILWDLLCLVGLLLVGRRFGGTRLAATLAFAWTAYPFTQYVLSSNTNDAIMPAFLIWGFWLSSSAWARGAATALAGWTKFGALLVAPLWLSYPDALRRPRAKAAFVTAFVLASAVAFSILLLEPNPLHAVRVFWDRTIGWQITRDSPFSIWDWGQYHARGLPDLRVLQWVLEGLLAVGALAAYFVPRRKSPLQLAALTAGLLIGFEVVLTHWFYLYIPWFFPFAAIAFFGRFARVPVVVEEPAVREHPARALVPAG
jgi:hypothetical protein